MQLGESVRSGCDKRFGVLINENRRKIPPSLPQPLSKLFPSLSPALGCLGVWSQKRCLSSPKESQGVRDHLARFGKCLVVVSGDAIEVAVVQRQLPLRPKITRSPQETQSGESPVKSCTRGYSLRGNTEK